MTPNSKLDRGRDGLVKSDNTRLNGIIYLGRKMGASKGRERIGKPEISVQFHLVCDRGSEMKNTKVQPSHLDRRQSPWECAARKTTEPLGVRSSVSIRCGPMTDNHHTNQNIRSFPTDQRQNGNKMVTLAVVLAPLMDDAGSN